MNNLAEKSSTCDQELWLPIESYFLGVSVVEFDVSSTDTYHLIAF